MMRQLLTLPRCQVVVVFEGGYHLQASAACAEAVLRELLVSPAAPPAEGDAAASPAGSLCEHTEGLLLQVLRCHAMHRACACYAQGICTGHGQGMHITWHAHAMHNCMHCTCRCWPSTPSSGRAWRRPPTAPLLTPTSVRGVRALAAASSGGSHRPLLHASVCRPRSRSRKARRPTGIRESAVGSGDPSEFRIRIRIQKTEMRNKWLKHQFDCPARIFWKFGTADGREWPR